MLKRFFAGMILLVIILGGMVLTLFAEEANAAIFIAHEDTHLTVYNNNMALVRETRRFELQPGLNQVDFAGVPSQLDFSSVMFNSLTDDGTYIVHQAYQPARQTRLNNIELVRNNIGEEIMLTLPDETITGTLLAADNYPSGDMLLQLEDGSIFSIAPGRVQNFRFSTLPEVMKTEGTLSLFVFSPVAGQQTLELTYLTGNIHWDATNYNLELADDGESVSISGWISIRNNTEALFEDASITLASGQFNRVEFAARDTNFAATQVASALPTSTASPTMTADYAMSGNVAGCCVNTGSQNIEQPDGLLFELDGTMTLDNGILQIEFLGNTVVNASNVYVYDASPRVYGYNGFNTTPSYGQTQVTHILNYLEISTRSEADAATDLLAGRMRIYRDSDRGTTALIGETTVAYTPEGETLRLFLDDSGEITGERRQTEFQIVSNDAVQESYELRLRNRSDEAVTIMIPERMTRSTRWEILGSSVPFEQPDPFTIEFEVTVPAGQDAIVNYTVLYTRPQ